MFFGILLLLIIGAFSAYIANGKGYPWVLGLILGMVLGLIGLIIVAVLPCRSSKKGSENFKISAGSIAYAISVILRMLGLK